MSGIERLSHIDMIRASPLQTALFVLVPVALAIVQLTNSVFNDLSFFVSVPFAIAMIGYAGLVTQFRFAEFRRKHLDAGIYDAELSKH